MYIVLVAGLPAAGKSSFTAYLSKRLHIASFNMERVQEMLFDTMGFSSPENKQALKTASFRIMLGAAEACMEAQQPIILEGNFESGMKEPLEMLIEEYGYAPITIHFGGNCEALYGRYAFRHNSPSRHRGHLCNEFYPEIEGKEQNMQPLSFDDFCARVFNAGMDGFSLGERVSVDTTDFGSLSYDELVAKIKNFAGMFSRR